VAVAAAGGMQVVAGLLGLGQWFRAVSPAVIRGMLAGIGFLILASQFHVMLDAKPPGSGSHNLAEIPDALARVLQTPDLSHRDRWPEQRDLLRDARRLSQSQTNLTRELTQLERAAAPHPSGHSTPAPHVPATVKLPSGDAQLQIAIHWNDLAAKSTHPAWRESFLLAARACEAAAIATDSGSLADAVRESRHAGEAASDAVELLRSGNLAALLGLLSLIIVFSWAEFAPKSLRLFPGALVAVLVVSTFAAMAQLPVLYVDLPDNLWRDMKFANWELLWGPLSGAILAQAAIIAVVASAETLLCCSAVDQMHTGPRTRYDRELFAQGVGNVLCGWLNALPMTGVIVRSSANVQAGAKSRVSAILHGLWLLVFVVGLSALLRQIPTSCLAAILVFTGYKLIDVKSIRELRGFGWSEVAIYAVTVSVIVFEDLLLGVAAGMALSALKLLYTFSRLEVHTETTTAPGSDKPRVVVRLDGAATFLRLPKLAAQLERLPAGSDVHVDFEGLDYIDHACLELLLTWSEQHRLAGGDFQIDWATLHARFHRERVRGENNPGRSLIGD
jgi:MFS superfamily sulfate permease-like transporter